MMTTRDRSRSGFAAGMWSDLKSFRRIKSLRYFGCTCARIDTALFAAPIR
jgi:hypothetical protein